MLMFARQWNIIQDFQVFDPFMISFSKIFDTEHSNQNLIVLWFLYFKFWSLSMQNVKFILMDVNPFHTLPVGALDSRKINHLNLNLIYR